MRGTSAKPGVQLYYREIRGQIRDGDIVLFRGTSWISRVLRWIMRSPYSHAGVVAWWHGRLMLLEAVATGVMASRMSWIVDRYSGHCELWTARDEHDRQLAREEVIRAAQLLIGRQYSKYKLVRNLRRLVFGRRQDEERDPEAAPDDFVCSEFVSRVWRAGGVDLNEDAPDVYTKPSDIARSPRIQKLGDLCRSRQGTSIE